MTNKKLLLISDSVIDRAILNEILSKDYTIYEASNADDALDFLHASPGFVDLIILDINMPSMNGRKLLKLLISDDELKLIPILSICPRSDLECEKYALNNGALDIIYKPFDEEIIKYRINNTFKSLVFSNLSIENSLLSEKQETQNRLQGILDNMDGGVMMIEISSSKHKIIYLNNGFYDLFHYSKEEFDGIKHEFLNTNIEKNEELISSINRSLVTKEKFSIETKGFKKNKSEIYLQIQGSILSNQKSDAKVILLIINDISDLKSFENKLIESNKKLKYRANYDALTNIYNRDAFLEALRLKLDENPNIEYAIIEFNFDKFKAINEILGNSTGDKILSHFASCLKKNINDKGVYGRIEADHFACLIETSELDENRITYMLDHCFDDLNLDYKIIIYGGVYIIKDRRIAAIQLLDRANLALKENKHNYLHRLNYYDDMIHSNLLEEQVVIAQMQDALKRHEFKIYLQPIYSIEKRCITKAEALVRWDHPQKGLLYPNKFISIFEKNGFITELDYYVWEEACKYLRDRIDRGLPNINLSVNISRVNIYRYDLTDKICDLIKKYNLKPEMLELEITESAYAQNPELLQEAIKKLKDKGFTVLMDDFGSAYSSLNALKDMNFDILKIDMKFLEDFETSRKSSNILSSIIKMAKSLNMKIVAEGVETIEQFNFLTSLNCDLIQGHLFSKPIPIQEFETKPLNYESYDKVNKEINDEFKYLFEENAYVDKTLDVIFGAFGLYEYENDNLYLVKYNNAFLDLFAFTKSDIVPELNLFDYVNLEDRNALKKKIEEVIAYKQIKNIQFKCFDKNGNLNNLDSYIYSVSNNKKLVGMILVPINRQEYSYLNDSVVYEGVPGRMAFAKIKEDFSDFSTLSLLFTKNNTDINTDDLEASIKEDLFNNIHIEDKIALDRRIKVFKENRLPLKQLIRIYDGYEYKNYLFYLKYNSSIDDYLYFSFALIEIFNINKEDICKEGEDIKAYLKRLYDDYPSMLVQVALIGSSFRMIFANDMFLKRINLSMEEFKERFDADPFPFTSKEYKLSNSKILTRILETGIPHTFSRRIILDNGDAIMLNISAHRIMNIDGNFIIHMLIDDISSESKKKAEVELNKFVSIFGSVYESIYECDLENDSYIVLKSPLGIEGERGNNFKKKLYKYIDEFFYEEDMSEVRKFISKVYENDQAFENENLNIRIYHNDRVTRALFNVTRITGSIFMIGYNILNEERLEQETYLSLERELSNSRASEEMYRHAVEAIGIALIRFDDKQNYMSHSLSKYNLFKCKDIEEFKKGDNIIIENDRLVFNNFVAKLEKDGKAEAELRLKCQNDDYLYNVVALNKVMNSDNSVTYYGYIKDIHVIKLKNQENVAKQILAESRVRTINSLMNNMPVGIGIFEIEGNDVYPIYANNRLIDMLNIPYSKLDYFIKEHVKVDTIDEKTKEKLLAYSNLNKSIDYQKYLKLEDGIKKISVALSVIQEETEIRVYASVLDVTDSISFDESRQNKNDYLKRLVANSNSLYFEYDVKDDVLSYFTLIKDSFRTNEINNYFTYLNNSNSVHEDFRSKVFKTYEDIVSNKKDKGSIECLAKFFGDYQWFRIEYKAFRDETDDLVKISGQVININDEVVKRKEYLNLIEKDQLSGLLNRVTAQNYIVSSLSKKNKKYAFSILDIDLFKSLNDNFGHPVGDKVIKKVAETLQECFNFENTVISRFGGDEFVVFFEYENETEIENHMNNLYEKVKDISKNLNIARDITLSAGIALSIDNNLDFDTLFKNADKALYEAKTRGKNRYCWYRR